MTTTEKPRVRNARETKGRILAAAQQAFADVGYNAVGIRQIAAAAGVDPALVIRYFSSKAGLYETALADAIPTFPGLDLSHEQFGERLATKLIDAFLDVRALAMIVLSAGDAEARAIGLKVMREWAVKPLAEWLGPPDPESRAIRMMMLLTGFMFYTRQHPLLSPAQANETATVEWLAQMLQNIINMK